MVIAESRIEYYQQMVEATEEARTKMIDAVLDQMKTVGASAEDILCKWLSLETGCEHVKFVEGNHLTCPRVSFSSFVTRSQRTLTREASLTRPSMGFPESLR